MRALHVSGGVAYLVTKTMLMPYLNFEIVLIIMVISWVLGPVIMVFLFIYDMIESLIFWIFDKLIDLVMWCLEALFVKESNPFSNTALLEEYKIPCDNEGCDPDLCLCQDKPLDLTDTQPNHLTLKQIRYDLEKYD